MSTATETDAPTAPPADGDEVEVLEGPHRGSVGLVTDINPNPNWREDGETWAELHRLGTPAYSTFADLDDPAHARVIRRKADIPTPKLPTLNELRDYLASAAHGGLGDLRVSETDTSEGEGSFILCGASSTGLPFSAIVTVGNIMDEGL